MGKKLTMEFVRKQLEKEGYKLLDNRIMIDLDSKTKLDCVCLNGHKHVIMWNDWQQGHRCKMCWNDRRGVARRKDYKDVKKSFESEGYTLLSKEYKNAHIKMSYICPNGHGHSTSWVGWKHSMRRCLYCAGQGKPLIEKIKEIFELEKCILLSRVYKNSKTKLNYICSEGHKHAITWSDWQHGYRCKTCYNLSMFGATNPNWKGGKSFEPYCQIWENKEYREDIKLRDDYKCSNPCCDSKNPNDLTIHHIDYNKKNCVPNNLITLCRSCNSRANTDRKWHTAWYQAIMQKRGHITL